VCVHVWVGACVSVIMSVYVCLCISSFSPTSRCVCMYALVRERERVRVCVYFNDFLLLLDLQLAQFSLQAQGMYVWVRACVGI